MKDLFTVIKFTMKDMVKRKSFIVSTIIFLVMIVVGFNIPQILKKIKGEDIGSKLIIVDENNVFEGSLETLKDIDTRYNIEIAEIRYEEIKEKIEDGDIESAIIIEKQDENIKVRYIVKNTTMLDGMPEDLISAINTLYSNLQISKLGLTEEQLKSITPNFEFSLEQTEEEKANGNIFAMMLLSIVLFYAIYFCAYQVSSSITTEKTSKIIETLVTSTAPRTIVLGKTIGIGVVGLLQMILLVGTALISAKVFLEPGILENIIDISTNNSIFRNGYYFIFYIRVSNLCIVICFDRFNCKQTRRHTICKRTCCNASRDWILFILFYYDESYKSIKCVCFNIPNFITILYAF